MVTFNGLVFRFQNYRNKWTLSGVSRWAAEVSGQCQEQLTQTLIGFCCSENCLVNYRVLDVKLAKFCYNFRQEVCRG